MAGTHFASIWSREGSPEVPVEAWLTPLAMLAFCVVLTVVADATAAVPRCLPHGHVEVAGVGVPVALARSALVRSPRSAIRCLPGPVVVQWCAVLAVAARRVVLTHALPVDHMEGSWGLEGFEAIHGYALISMAIAEAAALDNEIVDGIVCKMLGLCIQVISLAGTSLSFQELHTEVGDLQLLLSFGTVRVLRVIWW